MIYPSIRIEGAILSPDILGRIEEMHGQRPADFGLDTGVKVKDEIARAWADAQDYWRIFQRKLESVKPGSNATTETRNLWMVPLLSLLRYDIEYQPRGTELNGRIYAISHRAVNRANASVQIVGFRDPAGLDKKPANATRRMSAHALVQEFLNLHEELYSLVTNGHVLRLLRDSSRLVKQSYLEFDLDRIFTDSLFADFAILYRLLHATRLPLTNDTAAESLIERYHQDSLESGARIRDGLSSAVERAILDFGNGFLAHPANEPLRAAIAQGSLTSEDYYQHLLRLIYRLLFLMVIEERDLVFPPDTPKARRDIYRTYYSVQRLRSLSEKRYLADPRRHDLWLALQACFQLFEAKGPGEKLGIAPLAGDLFRHEGIGPLAKCSLGNDVLLGCLRSLSLYRHPDSGQLIRVNYAGLNVEEFGSVYEGLLEYDSEFLEDGNSIAFGFKQGEKRAATGAHYTPDDLVQPLIKHSLDHLIEERLKADDPEAALLDLRVADIACGSGHILLAAARRIATELAMVRTGEEQPSPPAYRAALRDVIRNCIYAVDLNPLAVELCKVAMWLEAHIPGQPLNFLDHHIKCGNAIVGFAHREELGQGVPTEAFKTLSGDDKEVAAKARKVNKKYRRDHKAGQARLAPEIRLHIDTILKKWNMLSSLPEDTPEQIDEKKDRFAAFAKGEHAGLLRTIADIPVAQFYIPKIQANETKLLTDADFRGIWRGVQAPLGPGAHTARALGEQKRIFHWFLEFPEIMERGGFDCILGNPPYLGGKKISGAFGDGTLSLLKHYYEGSNAGVDLVSYFVRRTYKLLHNRGFIGLIATKKVAQGDTRVACLDCLTSSGAVINHAVGSVRWPGKASVTVSLVGLTKRSTGLSYVLDGRKVDHISSHLDDSREVGPPLPLIENKGRSFQGVVPLGKGFYLPPSDADRLIAQEPAYIDVVKTLVIGSDLNSHPLLEGSRRIISFFDRNEDEARAYPACYEILYETVRVTRKKQNRRHLRERWWQFAEKRPALYDAIRDNSRVLVRTQASKHNVFEFLPNGQEYDQKLIVFVSESFATYAILNSDIHFSWVLRYSGDIGGVTLNYSPSILFETFPFPEAHWADPCEKLASVGLRYRDYRLSLMARMWLGLTDSYNLFHARDLTPEMVAKVSKKDADIAAAGYEALLELRRLHVAMDLAVRDAYGWQDLDLEHDFHEVETLPENDRVRYTISPAARREVLKRLLAENHARAAAEAKNPPPKPKRARRKRKATTDGPSPTGTYGGL